MTNTIFQAKEHAPYSKKDESKVFLDPNARASLDKESYLLSFIPATETQILTTNSPKITTTAPFVPQSFVAPTPSMGSTSPRSPSPAGVDAESIQLAQARNIQMLLGAIPSKNRGLSITVGVDVEEVASIDAVNDVFVQRNFTLTE